MSWSIDLSGEVALVTGGTRNIGLATARALGAAGAGVCLVGRSDEEALAAGIAELVGAGVAATGLLVDVGQADGVAAMFDHAETSLGPVSILVNAGANRPHQPLLEITPEDWQRVIDTILTASFLGAQELFRRLPEQRKGAVVNVGGLSAHRPSADRPHVIAAKAGVVGLTRALAEEGSGRIRVNCVVPGVIATERRAGQAAPGFGKDTDGRAKGTAEDVARAVVPLAVPQDSFTTGQTLHVNGGRYMP